MEGMVVGPHKMISPVHFWAVSETLDAGESVAIWKTQASLNSTLSAQSNSVSQLGGSQSPASLRCQLMCVRLTR